jgi:uncharacterized iron-regulated protein
MPDTIQYFREKSLFFNKKQLAVFGWIVLTLAILALTTDGRAASTDLPTHRISISFDLQEHTLTGLSRIEIPAGRNLTLHVGGLTISELTLNGVRITSDQLRKDHLSVNATDFKQQLVCKYTLAAPANGYSLNRIAEDGITLAGNWHPKVYNDVIFILTALMPDNFTGIAEADSITTSRTKEGKEMRFFFSQPHYSLHFAAGPYIVEEETFGSGKVLATYFYPEDQDLAKEYRDKTREYLARYEKMLGEYPYKRYSVVENRLPTGFALPTFTLLGQAVVRLPFIKDTSLGHEVLHSWFGNGVGIDIDNGNWAEGLTTYLADQTYAAEKGLGPQYRKEQLTNYQSFVKSNNELSLQTFYNTHGDSIPDRAVRAVGYVKGSMFFHMLRKQLGDKAFYAGLKDFYQRMRFKKAGWGDLATSFENEMQDSDIDLVPLFIQWITGSDVPRLTVSKLSVKEEEGRPVITFTLKQNATKPYILSVPMSIATSRKTIRKRVIIDKEEINVSIPLSSSPLSLTIDPDYDLMRQLTFDERPPTWSSFIGSDKKLAVLSSEAEETLYEPFMDLLEKMGCPILTADEVSSRELRDNSVIFLGTDNSVSRGLFARPALPETGLAIDIRKNPLNPGRVMILVNSSGYDHTKAAMRKLNHYGKYSFLHFTNGLIQEKSIASSETGIIIDLDDNPAGIETRLARRFPEIIDQLLKNRVVYIGEGHTNYSDHRLQLKIIRALYEQDPRLAIGMEMFSSETQDVLDEYINQKIDEREFLKKSKYFDQWRFDYRLYREIINFARRNRIPIIGLNLDREIVNSVYQAGGTDGLNEEQNVAIPLDRDLDIPGYRERIGSAFRMHGNGRGNKFSGFLQAQSIWDETMAETVANYLKNNPDTRMAVIAGRGHVAGDTAIPPRVARRIPVSQAVVLNDDGVGIDSDEADFVFFSYPAQLPPPALLGVILEDTEDKQGVLVKGLSPHGQAKEAGILKDDIILAIDGETVNSIDDIKIAMLYKAESDKVIVRIKRKGFFGDKKMDIEVGMKKQTPAHR